MSIPNTQNSLGHALEATNMAKRLGHLYAARVSLNAAIKSALTDAVEADAGQEQLPLGDQSTVPGHVHTVAADGVVMTPADEAPISEADAKKLHRRGRGRPKAMEDAPGSSLAAAAGTALAPFDESILPTEAQYEREQAEREAEETAAAAAAEPEWATV